MGAGGRGGTLWHADVVGLATRTDKRDKSGGTERSNGQLQGGRRKAQKRANSWTASWPDTQSTRKNPAKSLASSEKKYFHSRAKEEGLGKSAWFKPEGTSAFGNTLALMHRERASTEGGDAPGKNWSIEMFKNRSVDKKHREKVTQDRRNVLYQKSARIKRGVQHRLRGGAVERGA